MKNIKLLAISCFTHLLFAMPAFATYLVDELTELSLEQLLDLEVTSVARKPQKISESAAAIHVITGEDIRRSGVTSLPDALRLAPGVQVAQIDANKWAISIRGFNGRFANKLLVLIDGRTVYTPSYSGVYWDMQNTMLEDIDRIEVIRGPGATLWGANAVNGIINIITQKASDSHGGLASMGGGNEEQIFGSFRYGGDLGDAGHGRLYLKYLERDSLTILTTGDDAGDDYKSVQGGFRLDFDHSAADIVTLQGDIYQSDENQLLDRIWLPTALTIQRSVEDSFQSSGANLLGRWQHRLTDYSSTTLQVYYDHTDRDELFLVQKHDTVDLDFQHSFTAFDNHAVVWGLAYRIINDDFDSSFQVSISPDSQTSHLYSAFVQDDFDIVDALVRLTLGSKIEHNDYTGYEIQPNIRLLWTPHQHHSVWTAISRAVRTPSRVETDASIVTTVIPPMPPLFTQPLIATLNGNDNFDAEELIAYELGYRLQPRDRLSLDLALYYNDYDNLQSFQQVSPLFVVFDNNLHGQAYGLEVAVDWQAMYWWRLQAAYSYCQISLDLHTGSTLDWAEEVGEESTPEQQFSLRSTMDLAEGWQFDLWGYYVDGISTPGVSALNAGLSVASYTSINARLAWRPEPHLELSLIGCNLFDSEHLEYVGEAFTAPTEVERSFYGLLSLSF